LWAQPGVITCKQLEAVAAGIKLKTKCKIWVGIVGSKPCKWLIIVNDKGSTLSYFVSCDY